MKIISTFVFFAFCVMQSLAQESFLCPVPAPEVIQPDPICVYDETPEITATIGSYWGDGIRPTPTIPVQFKFYNSPTDFVPIEVNTTGKFTPYINKSEEKEYTYYVSEFNSNVLPQACEGPRTAVTISVKKVLPASLNPVSDVCAMPEGMNPTFIAYDYTGTIEWHPIAPPIPATTGSVAIGSLFQPSFTTLGIHTVWAVVRNNGCVSEPVSGSYVIKPIPAAPTVPNKSICENSPNNALQAIGSNIKWYQNANRTGYLQTSQDYIPSVTSVNSYTYYATQTVNGCESQTTPNTYTILPKPTPPITTSATMYEDDVTIPELRTDADTDVWYSDALCTTQISVGSSYVPSQKPVQTETFYVRRSNQYCYSDTVPVRLVYITNEFMFESQQLQETIDSAETLITQAQELKADRLRTYQAGAIADLQDEIDAAQAVIENVLATTQDVQQANASLKQAIETFHSMEITDISYTSSLLYIYPNPCNDILYIANTSEYIGVRITNAVGVVVFESEQNTCSIAHIPNGVYTVEVLTKSGVYRELVIKQ